MLRDDWTMENFWRPFYLDPDAPLASGDLFNHGRWLALTAQTVLGLDPYPALDLGSGTGVFADGYDAIAGGAIRRIDLYGPDHSAERLDLRGMEFPNGISVMICRDVLQYFTDAEADQILTNIIAARPALIYMMVPTSLDVLTKRSDHHIKLRAPDFYLERLLARACMYVPLRLGLWLRPNVRVPIMVLE